MQANSTNAAKIRTSVTGVLPKRFLIGVKANFIKKNISVAHTSDTGKQTYPFKFSGWGE